MIGSGFGMVFSMRFGMGFSMGFGMGLTCEGYRFLQVKIPNRKIPRNRVWVVNAMTKSTLYQNYEVVLQSFQIFCMMGWSGFNPKTCFCSNPVFQK